MKREKIHNIAKDKRIFSRTADRTRAKNASDIRPMRGGYRL